jgi:PAS domain S-box-containing protein/diguanylate cyclase (GGDEF)-like protein
MPGSDDPEVLRAVLDSVPMGVYLVDRQGKILLWNASAERITGHLRQDILGRSAQEKFLGYSDGQDQEVLGDAAPLSMALREGKPSGALVSLRHKQGHRVSVRLFAAPIRDSHGSVIGAAESFQETANAATWVERQSKLSEYGCIDEASSVLNHQTLQLRLRETLVMFAEKPVPFSLLCISIDHFEKLKQRHGPGVVAPILGVVGLTLENSLRPTDFLGRWKDNEFLAILTECGAEGLTASAERLRRMLSEAEVVWWGDPLRITGSLGGTTPRAGDDVDAVVARVEGALQESAKGGGNRVTVRKT